MFKVFYSWQSDLSCKTNRNLVLSALEKACSKIKSQRNIGVEPVVDRDTLGLSGAPDISDTVLSKISDADAFVADVSLINGPISLGRLTPNPNVLVELGYALAELGNESIILVFNTNFGKVEELPFDLRSLRLLTYHASPDNDERATVKKELEKDLKNAIESIASVVRNDPVYEIIYPKTLNVAGQANGMLSDLIKGAGKSFDPENMDEHELAEVCELLAPNGAAPLIVGGDAKQGWQYATWAELLFHWRERSRKFTSDVLMFGPILKPKHIALLATIEQCPYFVQLENLRGQRISNSNFAWLSSSIWRYLLATRQLKEYAAKVLARRATGL